MDPLDIAINAVQNLLQLRDINLARAEERGVPGGSQSGSRGPTS